MTQLRCCSPVGQISFLPLTSSSAMPLSGVPPDAWPRDTCERGILGALAVSLRPTGVQVALSSAHSRSVADPQLFRLSGYEPHRHIMAAIRAERIELGFPGDVRRTRHHALAHHHGCKGAAASGVGRLMLGFAVILNQI